MLEIRPNCECCNKDLPPEAGEAMICTYECTYECTFCKKCVEDILQNVCPNCGGGFCQRPVRPVIARRAGVSLKHQLASNKRVITKYSVEEIKGFAAGVKDIAPENR